MPRKRIGVLIPVVSETLNQDLLEGVRIAAHAVGYDVIAITNATNIESEYADIPNVIGEENIYRLAGQLHLDGILFCAGRFRNHFCLAWITDMLLTLNIPVVSVGAETEGMPEVYIPQRHDIRIMTNHLIVEHGCRRLYCLKGPESSFEARERLAGFCEEMDAHGLAYDDACLIYGDFWTESGKQLAKRIAEGTLPIPDGIICASDNMAVSLCEALIGYGISVPEQIKITGYDGTQLASICQPTLTTVGGQSYALGQKAFEQLYEIMEEKAPDVAPISSYVQLGASCGCESNARAAEEENRYLFNKIKYNQQYQELYTTSNCIMRLTTPTTLHEFSPETNFASYMLLNWTGLDLCLCCDWEGGFEQPDQYRTEGYDDNMLLLLSKRTRDTGEEVLYTFPTKEILPRLSEEHEPQFIVLNSLHCERQVFGYCAVAYAKATDYLMDERLLNWLWAISNGIRTLREKLYQEYMRKKIEEYSVRDALTGMYNKNGLMKYAPDYTKSLFERGFSCGILMFSWKRIITSPTGPVMDTGMMIANTMQLLIQTDEFAARTDEKTFVRLFPIRDTKTVEQNAQQWLYELELLLRSLQKKALQMPEFRYCTSSAETSEEFAEILMHTERELYEAQETETAATDYTILLREFRSRIRQAPELNWILEELAAEIGISTGHFQRLYKQQFGVPYREDIVAARFSKAKKLLRETNLRVQEVAEQCGYPNISHFMRQFKKRFGYTALDYRKRHSKENQSELLQF